MQEEQFVRHPYGTYTLLFIILSVGYYKLGDLIGQSGSQFFSITLMILEGAFIYFFVLWVYELIKVGVKSQDKKDD